MAVDDLVRGALRKGAKKKPSAKEAYKAEFDPRQFYHGSFEDIKAFDTEKAYPGSFMGRGQYITTSPVDAYKNYAHPHGGDVTAKLDGLIEGASAYAEDIAKGMKPEEAAKYYSPQHVQLAKTVLKTDPNLGELDAMRRYDYLQDAAMRQMESSGNVMPLKARLGNVLRAEDDPETFREVKKLAEMGDEDFAVARLMKERGYDSVEHDPTVHFRMPNLEANPHSGGKPAMHYMVPDPTRLRVPWAKFDPKKKGSSDLLAFNGKGEGMGKAVISALRTGANAVNENPYTTLDPEKGREANFWADLGLGILPVVGQAQAGRDFERARREDDPLGMGLAAVSAVPIAGKPVAMAAKAARKASSKFIPLTKQALSAVGLEPDMVRSLLSLKGKYGKQGVPVEEIERAKATRQSLRSEPATTPGANASPEEWAAWGEKHGVNMTQTPMQSLGISDLTSRREIMVPGGLEGTFTIPDLFALKARNFDPGALPKEQHDALMQKFLRTYARKGAPDEVDTFNALNFSLLSPNAPLTQNEFLAARARVQTPEQLKALALRSGTPGAKPTPESKARNKEVAEELDQSLGVGAAARGGMGVKGTANLENMPTMARLIQDKPEMFQMGEGEDIRDVTFRVMNQVPGLSSKTASLGTPFLDLAKGNTSAVDLHMIRNSYPRMLAEETPTGAAFRKRVSGLAKVPEDQVVTWAQQNPKEAEKIAIKVIGGGSPAQVYRSKKTGELAGGADPRVRPEKLAYEPGKITDFNDFYKRVMDYVDESRGPNPVLPLFGEQWRKWDTYRGRVEPHEFAHPDYRKLPKSSWSEMQGALDEHKAAGYMGTKKTMKESDWRKLYYGKADPMLLAGIAGAGGAGALTVAALRNRDKQNEENVNAP